MIVIKASNGNMFTICDEGTNSFLTIDRTALHVNTDWDMQDPYSRILVSDEEYV